MKRSILVVLALGVVATLPLIGQAYTVKTIYMEQASGCNGVYSHLDGQITWSDGVSGQAQFAGGSVYFGSVTVTGDITGVTDRSAGGVAGASFSTGTFSITAGDALLVASGQAPVALPGEVYVAGHVETVYNEDEVDQNDSFLTLNGRSVVIIDAFEYRVGGSPVIGEFEWDGGIGSQSGLIVDTVLTLPPDFTSYASEDYSSDNVTLSLYADEGVVPEPGAIALLAFGSLFWFRRPKP